MVMDPAAVVVWVYVRRNANWIVLSAYIRAGRLITPPLYFKDKTTVSVFNLCRLLADEGSEYLFEPSKPGYNFTPLLNTITIPQAEIQSYDFTATED
jgi:hypothetical protein